MRIVPAALKTFGYRAFAYVCLGAHRRRGFACVVHPYNIIIVRLTSGSPQGPSDSHFHYPFSFFYFFPFPFGPFPPSLFAYIAGANDAHSNIPMTAPVLTKVDPGDGPNCESTFTVAFYVPEKFQDGSVPKPLSLDVNTTSFPADTQHAQFYVRSFGGWTSDKRKIGRAHV